MLRQLKDVFRGDINAKTPLVLTDEKNYSTEVNANSERRGSTITFHDIHYSVQNKDPNKWCGKVFKEILTNVR